MKRGELLKRAEAKVKNGEWIIKQCSSSNIKEWERELEFNKQIVALIKKPEVTEEWVDKKATKFLLSFPGAYTYQFKSQLKLVKDFIRLLLEDKK